MSNPLGGDANDSQFPLVTERDGSLDLIAQGGQTAKQRGHE